MIFQKSQPRINKRGKVENVVKGMEDERKKILLWKIIKKKKKKEEKEKNYEKNMKNITIFSNFEKNINTLNPWINCNLNTIPGVTDVIKFNRTP